MFPVGSYVPLKGLPYVTAFAFNYCLRARVETRDNPRPPSVLGPTGTGTILPPYDRRNHSADYEGFVPPKNHFVT